MHGLILAELKRFSETSFGKAAWRELLREAGAAPPEQVEITDLTCMLKGKPTCTIAVRLVSGA